MRKKEGGEAPKGACQPLPRSINKRCRSSMSRRGCAPNRGAPAFRRYAAALAGTPVPAQLQAMLPGTWTAHDLKSRTAKAGGRYPPLLSQSSDSTSRLGRNTEGNDAQSRPGAGCKPARRHRTRSASESALAKASLDERVFENVTKIGTASRQFVARAVTNKNAFICMKTRHRCHVRTGMRNEVRSDEQAPRSRCGTDATLGVAHHFAPCLTRRSVQVWIAPPGDRHSTIQLFSLPTIRTISRHPAPTRLM